MTDKDMADAGGVIAIVAALADWLPIAVAFLAMLWYLVRFYALLRHWSNPEIYERPF